MNKCLVTLIAICLTLTQHISAQITFAKEYAYFDAQVKGLITFIQDDGYIMASAAPDDSLNYYLTLIKTDFYGDTLWLKYTDVGLTHSFQSNFYGTSDPQNNMYIILNNADYDLVKIDPNGNFIWGKTYPDMYFLSPVFGNNTLYAVERNGTEYYLSKINPDNGNAYGRIEICNNYLWWPTAIAISDEGEIAVSVAERIYTEMYTEYFNNIFTMPADSSTFISSFLPIDNRLTYLVMMQYDGNELCGIADFGNVSAPTDYGCVVRFLSTGEILLEQPVSVSATASSANNFTVNNNHETIITFGVYQAPDQVYQEMLCVSIDGSIIWSRTLPDFYHVTGLFSTDDEGYLIAGPALSGYHHPFLYKTDSLGGIVSVGKIQTQHDHLLVYPNPSQGYVTIEIPGLSKGLLSIRDLCGRLLTHAEIIDGLATWNTTSVIPGIYIFSTESGLTGKVIVE